MVIVTTFITLIHLKRYPKETEDSIIFHRSQRLSIPNFVLKKFSITDNRLSIPLKEFEEILLKYIRKKFSDVKFKLIDSTEILSTYSLDADIHIDATGGRTPFPEVKKLLNLSISRKQNNVDKLMNKYKCDYKYIENEDRYIFIAEMFILQIGTTHVLITEKTKQKINTLLIINRDNKEFHIPKDKIIEIVKSTNDSVLKQIEKMDDFKVTNYSWSLRGTIKRNNIYRGSNTLFWLVGDSCTKFSFFVGGSTAVGLKLIDKVIDGISSPRSVY